MVELPTAFQGRSVVRSAQHATDKSQKPYWGVVLDYGNGLYRVTDVYSRDGERWDAENGVYDVSLNEATEVFAERCERRDRFTHMIMRGECEWPAIAMMRWDQIPVAGRAEFTVYARDAAGKARDFKEFYAPGNRGVAQAVERWLVRYSEAQTHPDLRH